jgi:O-antigen/teichoic acid export membrane protein
MVAYFLSFKEVGIYSIALLGAEMIIKIPNWSAAILTPMVASAEVGHVRRTIYLFYTSIIVAAILGFLITLAIKLFPAFISNIIGRDFAGVETCMMFLLPRVVMQSGVGILAANLAGKGYPWYHPIGCMIPLAFVVILDIILVPRHGLIGAAMGNSLAYISAVIVFIMGFYRYNIIPEDAGIKEYCDSLGKYLRKLMRIMVPRICTRKGS